jgi:ubiquinone/menaquinone biosynthesis C-methylase UbiE
MTLPTHIVLAWQGIIHIALVTPDLAATPPFIRTSSALASWRAYRHAVPRRCSGAALRKTTVRAPDLGFGGVLIQPVDNPENTSPTLRGSSNGLSDSDAASSCQQEQAIETNAALGMTVKGENSMPAEQRREEDVTRFQSVDHTDEPAFFVQFLEAINKLESIQALKRTIATQLQVQEGHVILDVGCGIGDAMQALALLVGSSGRVVGVDTSELMIAEARRRSTGVSLPVDYRVGDAQHLDFADQTFDRCRADRVFMYVPDPRRALAEMMRVARSGARIVVFDIDWDGVMVNHPDRALTRTMMRLGCDSVPQGWIGRQLPALFQECGLQDVSIIAHTILPDYAFFTRIYRGLLIGAQETGILSASELTQWWDSLEQTSQAGLFFAAVPGFIVSGRTR